MAKRKRKSAKKSVKLAARPQHVVPDGWWRQVVSISMGLLALLLFLAMFNLAGPLPAQLFDFIKIGIGFSAYLLPLVLVILMVQKMISEENRLAFSVYFGALTFMISLSSFLHLFVEPHNYEAAAEKGQWGGLVGAGIDQLLASILSPVAAGFILLAIILLSVLFIMKMPIKDVLAAFFSIFRRDDLVEDGLKKKDGLPIDEKQPAQALKLNTGVPVVDSTEEDKPSPRLSSFRNSVKPDKVEESKEALTMASDPDWNLPEMDLLANKQYKADAGDIQRNAQIIKDTLRDFKIDVEMEEANVGPRVTQYTLQPPAGVRLSKITALDGNLSLNLGGNAIRIEAPIPGKRAVGVEVPNKKPAVVSLRSILESREWKAATSPLPFAIGKDISGTPIIGDLDGMPHLLIAGQTGSGKSVMVNTLLTSLLYRNSPADLKLILVDPKQVELTPYNHIPHLLTPVITQPEKTISALKWAVNEMERRYGLLAEKGKRNIGGYNSDNPEDRMPYIVIVIDELSDLMMAAARDVEALIVRVAQKARAVGIHLVLATQRPSVDVITGLIKANVPARIAFTVAAQVDSRTIIDQVGAEKLLGKGDMLITTASHPKPRRIQGVFVDDPEIMKITDFIKMQRPPEYNDEVTTQPVQISAKGGLVMDMDSGSEDSMYKDAVQCVIESGKASASLLQRRLRVGYARAARLIEEMEEQGIIGPPDGARPRDVLVSSMDDVFGGGQSSADVTDEIPDEE